MKPNKRSLHSNDDFTDIKQNLENQQKAANINMNTHLIKCLTCSCTTQVWECKCDLLHVPKISALIHKYGSQQNSANNNSWRLNTSQIWMRGWKTPNPHFPPQTAAFNNLKVNHLHVKQANADKSVCVQHLPRVNVSKLEICSNIHDLVLIQKTILGASVGSIAKWMLITCNYFLCLAAFAIIIWFYITLRYRAAAAASRKNWLLLVIVIIWN